MIPQFSSLACQITWQASDPLFEVKARNSHYG